MNAKEDELMKKFDGKITFVDSPNFNARPIEVQIDTIVLHHTVADLQRTFYLFQKPENVAAHFTIAKDGEIYQHVLTQLRAWHAGVSEDQFGRTNVNDFSIGIELINKGNGLDTYPTEQIESLVKLLRYLLLQFPIKQITTHAFVARPKGRKIDPYGYPWSTLSEFDSILKYEPDSEIQNL